MARTQRPAWLPMDLDEVCGYCLQVYVYEQRVHCRHCDEPICPECVVEQVQTQLTLCPKCAEAADQEQ